MATNPTSTRRQADIPHWVREMYFDVSSRSLKKLVPCCCLLYHLGSHIAHGPELLEAGRARQLQCPKEVLQLDAPLGPHVHLQGRQALHCARNT